MRAAPRRNRPGGSDVNAESGDGMERAGGFFAIVIVLLILAVAAMVLYVFAWTMVAGFMLYLIPGLLVLMMISALTGAPVSLMCVYQVLTDAGTTTTKLVTPHDVAAGTSGLPPLTTPAPVPRDWAWPTYLASQWRSDLKSAVGRVRDVVQRVWRKSFNVGANVGIAWVRMPLAVLGVPMLSAFTAGAVLGGALIVIIGGIVLISALGGWAAASGSLHALDTGLRRLRRASATCPACDFVMAVPSFRCRGCGSLHGDLRPGRLGGVWRRCGCGHVLPTTVLRAAGRLTSHCARCGIQLSDDAAVTTDIRVPVFGPVSAGKTRLVYAGLLAMRERITAEGGYFAPEGQHSHDEFAGAVEIIRSGADTVKTPVGERPHPVVARVVLKRDVALMHLFDAAGEYYVDREQSSSLEFLDHAQSLIFVIDPFSIPWVRDRLVASSGDLLASAKPATVAPEQVYHATVGRLLQYGLDMKRRWLALAVVKADLLVGLPFARRLFDDDPRAWLMEVGLDNLVLGAERDFAKVCFFVAASVGGPAGSGQLSPANPLMWSIDQVGLRPAAARPARQRGSTGGPVNPDATRRSRTFTNPPPGYRSYRVVLLTIVGAGVLALCSLGILAGDDVLRVVMTPVNGVRNTWTNWGWRLW